VLNSRRESRCLGEHDNVQLLRNDHGRNKVNGDGRVCGSGQCFLRRGTLRWDAIRDLNRHQHVVGGNLIEVKMGEHLGESQRRLLGRVDDRGTLVIAARSGVEPTRAGEVVSVRVARQAVGDQTNMP